MKRVYSVKMEWAGVPLDIPKRKKNIADINPGESVYAIFMNGSQKFLVYIANITKEDCETIGEIREKVAEEVDVDSF